MIFKPKIKKVFQSIPILLTALILSLLINTIQTYAYDFSGWAASIVDSQGKDSTATVGTVPLGVSTSRTGYLCYLLDKNGQKVPGTTAVALSSQGFEYYSGSREWIAKSRKGDYAAGRFSGEAPWKCTPWQSGSGDVYSTNEPQIRAYFEQMNGDQQKGIEFVQSNWKNADITRKFRDGEVYLVIETLMHFQYSIMSKDGIIKTAEENYSYLVNRYRNLPSIAIIGEAPEEVQKDYYKGLADADAIKYGLIQAISKQYLENPSSFEIKGEAGWRTIGNSTLVGTVPNLITYRNNVLQSNTNVFNKFTHKIACFAEYIQPGNIGEQIGFKAWTGGTSSQMTDSDVQTYGVAMMVISAKPAGQTTCDESQLPQPHKAPVESTGTTTIIKNYRTKTGPSQYKDTQCLVTSNLSSQILVETEKDYQVVGWATSSSTSTIPSETWPVPSPINKGTTPTTITLDPDKGEKTLYVLLEKTEVEPEEVKDYNYKLTESSITRRVLFTKPDNRLSMKHIENHTFRWVIREHQTTCPGHTFTNACHGKHEGPHNSNCAKACPDTCTNTHPDTGGKHATEGCTDPHYYDCGQRCTEQTAKCSGWQWHEKNLKLSINNSTQDKYPTILVSKSGWNAEVKNGHTLKHY